MLTKRQFRPTASRFPATLGWVCLVVAALCFVGFLMKQAGIFTGVHLLLIILALAGLPAIPSLGMVTVYLICALLAFMRKRAVVWLAIVVLVFNVLTLLIVLVSLIPGTSVYAVDLFEYVVVAISAVMMILHITVLVRCRAYFPGRMHAQAIGRTILVAVSGLAIGIVCSVGILAVVHPLHSLSADARWSAWHLVKPLVPLLPLAVKGPPLAGHGPHWLSLLLSIWGVIVVIAAALVFFRGQRLEARTKEEDRHLRRLLFAHGADDSLGYFATRNNRYVVFSRDGKAAVSYGLAAGVALAAGDPIGERSSWGDAISRFHAEAYEAGYIPAVISASEAGAAAYRRHAHMIARLMGDEAIVRPQRFDARAESAKALRASARRVRRAGVTIEVRRQGDIGEKELAELTLAASAFRRGEERGFSMALGREFDPVDADTMVVTARGSEGELECLLTFVPWGPHGLSLDLMRRRSDSVNGIVEAMILELIDICRDQRIEGISLNFAMFRKIFVEGEAVNAGIVKRLLFLMFRQASKVWQLESLYESNARYQPDWNSRYMCFGAAPTFAVVLAAAGMLEGFLPAPTFLVPPVDLTWESDEDYRAELDAEKAALRREATRRRPKDQERVRIEKAGRLRQAGMDPYPPGYDLGLEPGQAAALPTGTKQVRMSGRIDGIRDFGGIIFADLLRDGHRLQIAAERDRLGEDVMAALRLSDIGDIVTVSGDLEQTRTGEKTLFIATWKMAAKSLRPVPRSAIALDTHTRTRQRALTLMRDPAAMTLLRERSRAIAVMRAVMAEEGFCEVETPMLQAVQGGANARPFITHLNAYSTDVFLRIAPELYLKRLCVAGMDAIYEIGRSFRNEGADATHNPEFTSMEAYRAGGDYVSMRHLTETLIRRCARSLYGKEVIHRPAGTPGCSEEVVASIEGTDMVEFDISGTWPVIPVLEAVSQACDRVIDTNTGIDTLAQLCRDHGIEPAPGSDAGGLITALYDELVEAKTVHPTFYTDFPVSTSPLTRRHRDNPRLAERWDLVAFGMELGTAYTELTDPLDQRERFTEQSLAAAAGDPEAMSLDEDFLRTLELGMPPLGGLGLGVDRLVMLLTGATIRQILAFPFVRPDAS